MARGLQANSAGLLVSVAHPAVDDALQRELFAGVEVLTWTRQSLPDLLKDFDTIVVSFCAIGLAPIVVTCLKPDQQLILDCNVPFYVEVSARGSVLLDQEFKGFMGGVPMLAPVLARGDVFLCASERQKLYYQGVLSGIGRLNPATYGTELFELVPYGIDGDEPQARARPIDALTRRPASTKLLWFGSLYPWFDIEILLEAVALLNERGSDVTLTIVGARNPTSRHPDFLAKFDAFDALMQSPRYSRHAFNQQWVRFDERADWYLNADLGVTINKPGLENSLAWRTRLVDMVWGQVPVATNGGDPLGDELLENGAALRLRVDDATQLAEDLQGAIDHSRDHKVELRANLEGIRTRLEWNTVTRGLAGHIRARTKAADLKPPFLDYTRSMHAASNSQARSALRRLKALLKARLGLPGRAAVFRRVRRLLSRQA